MPINEDAEIALKFRAHQHGEVFQLVYDGMKSAGHLDVSGVKMLFYDVFRKTGNTVKNTELMNHVQKIVRSMNDVLLPFKKGIRKLGCENTGVYYFMLVYYGDVSVQRFQERYSAVEVEYFQILVDDMIRKYDNFALPLTEATDKIQEVDAGVEMSLAQDFLGKMLALQYFVEYSMTENSSQSDITLGPRAMFEFETLLREKYGAFLKDCGFCNRHLLQGLRCEYCKVLTHIHCPESCSCLNSSKEAILPPRYRETDHMIETQGPHVDIRSYVTSNDPSSSYNGSTRKYLFRT